MSIYGNMFENKSVIATNNAITETSTNYGSIDIWESMLDFTFEYSILENSYIIESDNSNLSVLKENAIKTIWNKIKEFAQWLWEQIKKLGTLIANFFKNLFSRNKQNEAKAKIIETEVKKKDQKLVKDIGAAANQEIKAIEAKFDYSKAGFPNVSPDGESFGKASSDDSKTLSLPDNGGSKDLPATSSKQLPASRATKAEKKVGGVKGQVAKLVDKSTANENIGNDKAKAEVVEKVKKFMTKFNFANLFPQPKTGRGYSNDNITYSFGKIFDGIKFSVDKSEFTNNKLGEFRYMDDEYNRLKKDIYHAFFFDPKQLNFKGKAPSEANPFAATKPMWLTALDLKMHDCARENNKSFNWDPLDKSFLSELNRYSRILSSTSNIYSDWQKKYQKGIDEIKDVINRVSKASTYNYSERIEGEGDDARIQIMAPKMASKWLGDIMKVYALNLSCLKHVISAYGESIKNITKLHDFVFALVKTIPNQKAA